MKKDKKPKKFKVNNKVFWRKPEKNYPNLAFLVILIMKTSQIDTETNQLGNVLAVENHGGTGTVAVSFISSFKMPTHGQKTYCTRVRLY